MQDRNFDDIAEKFARNIYGTTKGKIRQAVVWQDLTGLLAQLPQRPLRILDAGGGEGHMACQLAELGHQVLLCDLSGEMIQRAAQLAEQKGVSQNMQFVQSSAQDIAQHLEQPVDLILFHAVLEWIAEPEAALQALYDCLTPGGALSLMFFNANGLLMRNVVLGNFQLVDPRSGGAASVRCRRNIRTIRYWSTVGWNSWACASAAKPACGCSTTICRADSCKHKNLKSYWRLNSTIAGRSRT